MQNRDSPSLFPTSFVTATRFLRKNTLKPNSYLAIIALPDEASAFQAYRLLQYHGISPEHLAIVGEGYSSPDRVGLLQPMQIAFQKARSLAIITGPVGSAIGLLVALALHVGLSTPLNLNLMLAIPAGGIVGGFTGAAIGGLFGFLVEGSSAGVYHHHLRKGHYLLMMEGPEKLVRWGEEVLKQYSAPKTR